MQKHRLLHTLIYIIIYAALLLSIYQAALFSNIHIGAAKEELILHKLQQSPILIFQILFFALALLLLHIAPLVLLIKSANLTQQYFKLSPVSKVLYFTASLLAMWVLALAINQQYYPNSKFSYILPILHDKDQRLVLQSISIIILSITVLLPIAVKTGALILSNMSIKSIAPATAFLIAGTTGLHFTNPEKTTSRNNKPNIIFIGIDSISPLHLQHNPGEFEHLRSLINSGTSFSQSITPLARTFPAWTSILTGKYPVHNGARFNLLPIEEISHQTFLPKILKDNGYSTIYAQDERKFNNLDESFGFDKIIGPSVGASEFILTKVSDLPFLNLFILLPYSEYIFPQITYNRADHIHYSPERFVSHLIDQIPDNGSKPLFLAAHFCLAHFPYTWRNNFHTGQTTRIGSGHKVALTAIQKQINQLLISLKEKGYLENSLLVLLSDHGESLSYDDGLWIDTYKGSIHDRNNPFFDYLSNMKSGYSGHGTSVLDKTQYTTLLTFKGYGKFSFRSPSKVSNKIASLVDVMPTVLTATGLPMPTDLDGQNLLSIPNKTTATRRVALAETGITFMPLLSMDKFDETTLLNEAEKYFKISPGNGRIILRSDRFQELLESKQYAIHTNDWILVFSRMFREGRQQRFVLLVHKPSGRWTLGGDRELIEESPIQLLTSEAIRLLGNEIESFSNELSLFDMEQNWITLIEK